MSDPLLLGEESFLEDRELRSKGRERMEEDVAKYPTFVMFGLEDYRGSDNVVRITRKNSNGTLSHFGAPVEDLKALEDEDNSYRSLHAKLYKVVNSEFPNKKSHKTWFGWSTRKENPKFFCYTLNSAEGWNTEKAKRRATMTDFQDLVSQENFDLLVADFERRQMSKTLDIDPLVEAYQNTCAELEDSEEVISGEDSGEESSEEPVYSSMKGESYQKLPEKRERKTSMFSSLRFRSPFTKSHHEIVDEI